MRTYWNTSEKWTNPDGEESTILAAVALLAKLSGQSLKAFEKPDRINRNSPDIDAQIQIGDRFYAIEHTLLEPFEYQMKNDHAWTGYLGAEIANLGSRLNIVLPNADQFCLELPARLDIKRGNIQAVVQEIEQWTLMMGPTLGIKFPDNVASALVQHPSGQVRVRLRRERRSDIGDGGLGFKIVRLLSIDERDEKAKLIDRVLATKLPKLARYQNETTSTVLVIERVANFPTPYIPLFMALRRLPKESSQISYVIQV